MISVHEQQAANGFYVGRLTLNLPQTLNALTLEMAHSARRQLSQWATRANIACVVIEGEGRAFCAGGDVRRMRKGILEGNPYCEQFFEQEYRLDHAIHHYPKPLLVLGHGVVMGGGIGLLIGASHRVVTGSTRMAMPETSIGLYPDVGASYFLNRLPAGLGLFLGITGCEWNGADAVALGMADYLLEDSNRDNLPRLLETQMWTGNPDEDKGILGQVLASLPAAPVAPQLAKHLPAIGGACSGSLQQALDTLPTLPIREPWFSRALENLTHGCPVTARIVEQQLQRARGISLSDAFRMEWTLSVQCCRHPDFPEGVRAQLVDKDKQPRWSFPSPAAVPDAYVDAHFVCPVAEHPLLDLT